MRMIAATNVACRAAPDPSAPAVRSYRLGDRVPARHATDKASNWFLSLWDRCWVAVHLSTPYDRGNPEPALLAAADHILARTRPVPFADYVAVENLLLQTMNPPHSGRSVLASSGLLQFRRLQIITRAIATPEASGRKVAKAPLMAAWFLAHDRLVRYFGPADEWYVPVDVYWELFEKHKAERWAEELAWAAAQIWMPSDECYTACALGKIVGTFARYWSEYPRGVHVSDALARAAKLSDYGAAGGCTQDEPEHTMDLVASIRQSLSKVIDPGGDRLQRDLTAIARACGGMAPSS